MHGPDDMSKRLTDGQNKKGHILRRKHMQLGSVSTRGMDEDILKEKRQ
jgi:hypothetical protein